MTPAEHDGSATVEEQASAWAQVEGARHALQHNLGPRGACVVTMYERI